MFAKFLCSKRTHLYHYTLQDIARVSYPESQRLGEFYSIKAGCTCIKCTFEDIARVLRMDSQLF